MAPEAKRVHATAPGHRFRRREIELGEGGKLVLHADGSISQIDAEGKTVGNWAAGDPEWPRHAIRFGVLPQPATETPPDQRVKGARPPGS